MNSSKKMHKTRSRIDEQIDEGKVFERRYADSPRF